LKGFATGSTQTKKGDPIIKFTIARLRSLYTDIQIKVGMNALFDITDACFCILPLLRRHVDTEIQDLTSDVNLGSILQTFAAKSAAPIFGASMPTIIFSYCVLAMGITGNTYVPKFLSELHCQSRKQYTHGRSIVLNQILPASISEQSIDLRQRYLRNMLHQADNDAHEIAVDMRIFGTSMLEQLNFDITTMTGTEETSHVVELESFTITDFISRIFPQMAR